MHSRTNQQGAGLESHSSRDTDSQREGACWSMKNEQQGEASQKVGSGVHLGETKGQVGVIMEMGTAGGIQG